MSCDFVCVSAGVPSPTDKAGRRVASCRLAAAAFLLLHTFEPGKHSPSASAMLLWHCNVPAAV
jgi:hypothetical protein